MKLDKKMEYYLRNSIIEFNDNYLLEVIPQNEKDAVILTAPKGIGDFRYFTIEFKGYKYYYGSIEQMMDYCIARGYVNRRMADKIIKDCHTLRGDE